MNILQDFGQGLKMAAELPFFVALPLYLISYGVAVYVLAKAIKAIKDIFK